MPLLEKFAGDPWTAGWAAAAAVVEALLYATLARERWRARWCRGALVAAAPLSYLIYAAPLGSWSGWSTAALVAMAAAVVCWRQVCGARPWAQYGLLALLVGPILFKVFALLYAPAAGFRMDFLGQLMWIRTSVLTVLWDLEPRGVRFGFWPERKEWKSGVKWFLLLLPLVCALAWATGFARPAWPAEEWGVVALKAAGAFFGILWVVALSEEFFFRGLLQQWIGLWAASAAFGLVHLGFRQFPNWRFALVSAVAGVFYGLSFREGGGIRSAMVTHALTVVAWRTLFR